MREAHWGRGAKPLSRESERGRSRCRGRESERGRSRGISKGLVWADVSRCRARCKDNVWGWCRGL